MKLQFESETLTIFESELFRTTCTLIQKKDHLLLVDPNWLPSEVDFIYNYIQKKKRGRPLYLFFTHSDYDHIIGYGKFAEIATTIASENFVLNEDKESILNQIRVFDDQYYLKRNYSITYPIINQAIKEDGYELKIGESAYTFYQATGHNSDGLICLDQSENILIVGDYLSNIEFPYVYHSFSAYLETLNSIESICEKQNVATLISGHGDYANDQKEIEFRLKTARNYITQVKNSILDKTDFEEAILLKKYDFPLIMAVFHKANLALAAKEFIPK